jgi:hypothetical protein
MKCVNSLSHDALAVFRGRTPAVWQETGHYCRQKGCTSEREPIRETHSVGGGLASPFQLSILPCSRFPVVEMGSGICEL